MWWMTTGKGVTLSLATKDASRSRSTHHRMRWSFSAAVTVALWWLLVLNLMRQTLEVCALDSIDTVRSASTSNTESAGNEVDGTRVLVPDDGETDQPMLWGSASGATAEIAEPTYSSTGSTASSNVEFEMEPLVAFESQTDEKLDEGSENEKGMEDYEQVAFTAPPVSIWIDLKEEGAFDDVLDENKDGAPDLSHPGRPLVVFQGSFQHTINTVILDDAEAKLGDEDMVHRDIHRSAALSTKGEASSGTTGKRLWGADHHHHHSTQLKSPVETDTKESNDQQPPSSHFPFIKSKPFQAQQQSHEQRLPPEGFALAARVYIDSQDNLAHFDYPENDSDSDPLFVAERRCDIALPYFDCGALGSTTAALSVKHVYFRHMLSSTHTVWRDPQLRPVFAVALTPLRIELDSGEAQDFQAGDVILLEDSMQPGHQILATTGPTTTSTDKTPSHVSILFVTLPKPHYHVGKQHLSLQKVIAKSNTPCRDIPVTPTDTNSTPDWDERNVDKDGSRADSSTTKVRQRSLDGIQQLHTPMVWNARRFRLVALGTVSLSLSTLVADFLAKTAPLWLAVGIGGTCFVVGATYGLVVAGDNAFTAWDLWREQQRLDQTKRQRSGQQHDGPDDGNQD